MGLRKYLFLTVVALSSVVIRPVFADDEVNNQVGTNRANVALADVPTYDLNIETTYASESGVELSKPLQMTIKPGERLQFGNVIDVEGYHVNFDKTQVNLDGYEGTFSQLAGLLGMDPVTMIDYMNQHTWDGTKQAPDQYIHFVYDRDVVNSGNVVVKYQDESGNQIADEKTLTGDIGAEYSSKQLQLAGYTFEKIEGEATGVFSKDSKVVIYIYTKNISEVPASSNSLPTTGNALSSTNGAKGTGNDNRQKTLPNTDLKSSGDLSVMGGLLTIVGVVGLMITYIKRRS